jgi:cellulose synthase/poly-beta-1,6-N-acetylglucosamine synthase-like glycosyltransferase
MRVAKAILLGAGLGILVPAAIWSIECAAALLPSRRKTRAASTERPDVAVLVPAHNEACGIRRTLDSLTPQMRAGDRIVVVADNCTDDTARIARDAGAIVLERADPVRHGKSYALEFGVDALYSDAAPVIVVVDADCTVHPGAIDQLAIRAFATGRPVQANYVLETPSHRNRQSRIAALAFLIQNFVRPSGLDRLGLPCLLNGSGMAFPADVLRHAPLGSGRIAEDRWLTADLALAGHLPVFCPGATISGSLPDREDARQTQRRRWIHGHLECIVFQGPRLLAAAFRQGRLDILGLFCDLCVPPLSLLFLAWSGVTAVTLAAGFLGAGWLPAILPVAAGVFMSASFCGVILRFGDRDLIGLLPAGPAYAVSQLPVFLTFVVRRQRTWVRTGRDAIEQAAPPQP